MEPAFDRALRTEFPLLQPRYFDTASVGPVPNRVRTAVAVAAEALGGGTRGSAAWHTLTDPAAEAVAAELGTSPERVSFLASTGEAINGIARAIPWRDSDEVICFEDDFPTVILPWTGIGDGVQLRQITPGADDERTEAMIAAITARTRVVVVSHVHPATGTTVDLRRLGEACRTHEALLIVDGAQGAGAVKPDLELADAYVATAYKWLLSGFGAAAVVTSERFEAVAKPTLLGYGNTPPSPRLTYGHQNVFGLAAIAAAAQLRQDLGLEATQFRIREHALRLHRELTATGWQPTANESRLAGIVSVHVGDPAAYADRLAAEGFAVAIRRGVLRISPGFTVRDIEVTDLLDALGRIRRDLPIGAR